VGTRYHIEGTKQKKLSHGLNQPEFVFILFPQHIILFPQDIILFRQERYFVPQRKIFCSLNILFRSHNISSLHRTVGVMVSVHASSAVNRGFEPRSGQTKHFKIGIWRFSAKHASLRRKSSDWLSWNQNNVSKWGNMSSRGLFFQ
jgi:hypothetical protein